MRRGDIVSFVEGFLAGRGVRAKRLGGDAIEAGLDPSTLEPAGSPRVLAFSQRALKRYREAEAAGVGSALLDRILARSLEEGRIAVAFEPVSEEKGTPPGVAGAPSLTRSRWASPRLGYRPFFIFVFWVEYHMIDIPDDLVVLGVDALDGSVTAEVGELLSLLKDGKAEPQPGLTVPPAVPERFHLARALDALDRRLQRRARKVKESSATEIARETANIEAYYRQLIDEVRHPVGRGKLSAEEEEERVKALQLDWKRRVQEVSGFWEAAGDVHISAMAVLMRPSWLLPVRPRRKGKRLGPFAYARLGQSSWELRCATCGAKLERDVEVRDAKFLCAQHAGTEPRTRETEEGNDVSERS